MEMSSKGANGVGAYERSPPSQKILKKVLTNNYNYGIIIIESEREVTIMLGFFIGMGLILSIIVGVVLYTITFEDCFKGIKKILVSVGVALLIGFGVTTLIFSNRKRECKEWNNGICKECGEEFELFDIETVKYEYVHKTIYYYKCSNNHCIETTYQMKK